ncbi:hypothetical protein [Hymenobacter cellulosilyticus]|uniref:DUF4303 domain-containing protein n=1 Tax=Hymenobacter cellulosilyticus TaxID=2932248 RepID=A0A8T9Q209_9BACT|nr:hypothetical protein [Hymenobacter cellulosilyticus]UOQ71776.1 hypothetical protein MUN79_24760 [Hymenobacter cellulosilyticus]
MKLPNVLTVAKKKKFDFQALGESVRADTQAFLDTYGAQHPEDGPIVAFCLYFDSQGSVNSLVLPHKALAQQVDVNDPAAWYQYADHVEAPQSERTEELLSGYEEAFWQEEEDEDEDEDDSEALIQQFHQMITEVTPRLSFDKLPRTDDFVFYATGMDEDYDAWNATIPAALLKKHFDQ